MATGIRLPTITTPLSLEQKPLTKESVHAVQKAISN